MRKLWPGPRLHPGDPVYIEQYNGWQPGVVVAKNRGRMLAKYVRDTGYSATEEIITVTRWPWYIEKKRAVLRYIIEPDIIGLAEGAQ